jgi:hypothetical protein
MNANALCQSGSQFSTGGKADGLYFLKEPDGDPRPGFNNGRKTLGKDFANAGRIAAEELADREMKDHLTACTRDISQRPPIPTMDVR